MSTEILNTSTTLEAPVLDVIKSRRSSRAYSAKPVGESQLQALFEAARWAPSSMNEQPWTYFYATRDQPEHWRKLFDALSDGNKIWAKHAPILLLSLIRKHHLRNGLVNQSAAYDVGAANAFLSIQAESLGLNVHQMGGFNKQAVCEAFSIKREEYDPAVIMAIGYPGDVSDLPENLQQRELAPRARYTRDSFAFRDSLPE